MEEIEKITKITEVRERNLMLKFALLLNEKKQRIADMKAIIEAMRDDKGL